jgi:plasmid stabilization system protein ParE
MTAGHRWQVVLTGSARRDFEEILSRTTETFGARQAERYAATLRAALRDLSEGPDHPLVRRFEGAGLLHIGRRGRAGRHFIAFRHLDGERRVIVLRILHDSMDLKQHIPDDDPSS